MSYKNITFKNTGNNSKDINDYNKLRSNVVQEFPIGIKMPPRKGSKKGETIFAMNFDVESQIKDNLMFLLTCDKNEILLKPDYGTNLSALFNSTNLNKEELNNLVKQEISSSVESYMNPVVISGTNYFINLFSFSIKEDTNDIKENFYRLDIEYNITGYSKNDIEIIKKINNSENIDYLMSKINKIIIKFRTSN